MIRKIIGSLLVIVACGGLCAVIGELKKKEIGYFKTLLRTLELMRCELEYRMTPLPQLCRTAGEGDMGLIGRWFRRLGELLDRREVADITGCTKEVMMLVPTYHPHIAQVLELLCQSLGRFDLSGQLDGFHGVIERCETELVFLSEGIDRKIRTIRTLGVCTGTALAILLM